jgi:hypothetical protein
MTTGSMRRMVRAQSSHWLGLCVAANRRVARMSVVNARMIAVMRAELMKRGI